MASACWQDGSRSTMLHVCVHALHACVRNRIIGGGDQRRFTSLPNLHCRCLLHYLNEPKVDEQCNVQLFIDQHSKRVFAQTLVVRHPSTVPIPVSRLAVSQFWTPAECAEASHSFSTAYMVVRGH